MKHRSLYSCVFVLAVMAVGLPSHVFADLISVTTIPDEGIALGPGNTLLTIHHGANGIESGCISQNGSFTPCLNTATTQVPGGDNVGLNQVLTMSTDLGFAAVVTPKEPGDNFTGSLTDLYLTFSGSNGSYTAEYLGQDVLLSPGSAFFTLSDADLVAVQSLGSSVTVSGGLSVEGQHRGPETLHVVQFQGPQGSAENAVAATVPEPSTALLLGSGMILIAVRKKLRNY
jgi:hypothetical protein